MVSTLLSLEIKCNLILNSPSQMSVSCGASAAVVLAFKLTYVHYTKDVYITNCFPRSPIRNLFT